MKSLFFRASAALLLINVASHPLTAQENAALPTPLNASAALSRYQWALDQLAQGNTTEARVILEESNRRHGTTSETTLLLAHLLQREGKFTQARELLRRFVPTSALASEFINSAARGSMAQNGTTPPRINVTNQASSPSAVPVHRLSQSDARLAKLEKVMAQMVNVERERAGLRALTYSEELADVARAHAAEMRDKKYFAHESPVNGRREPLDRYTAGLKRTPRVVAENIYRAWGTRHRLSEQDIRSGHDALMKSSGHRANILLPNVQRIGIGIVANENGDIWLAQLFDRP